MKEIFQRQMGGRPQIKIAEKRADALWTYAKDAANGKISARELEKTCRVLVEMQIKDPGLKCSGLWPVMVVDWMPSEAWVDFIYMPSYAACAILLCGYHQGFAKRIPEMEPVLRSGLAAAFPKGMISSHGNEWEETTKKVLDLMDQCGLQNAKELFGLKLRSSIISYHKL